ncbi:MAG TPA: tRNA glutamyl-Q(34) synthetase GluQRS [Opitutaceae bacterium]|nr:tRNA glutamyl-Q(34) synthetase GluQRS [Opitutaceae bacterium]
MNGQGLYRGRLAPSPTGYLHLGHARTFWIAAQRAAGGELFLRNDDLDRDRCRPEFVQAFREDLAWLGLRWREPMVSQSERLPLYRKAFERLAAQGLAYPCTCTRREIQASARAPHEDEEAGEPIYPGTCRPPAPRPAAAFPARTNWRFRVPEGRRLAFEDGRLGPRAAVAGTDFGDFLIWRKDGWPSYQLACAVDDADMGITEVVRGADLILSTFRQILLLEALRRPVPAYAHCELMRDEGGRRLAKRHDALSLRALRGQGLSPAQVAALLLPA